MRHLMPPRPVLRRRGLGTHRPRPVVWSRANENRAVRTSDLVLALIGVTLIGALGLMVGVVLLGRTLAP